MPAPVQDPFAALVEPLRLAHADAAVTALDRFIEATEWLDAVAQWRRVNEPWSLLDTEQRQTLRLAVVGVIEDHDVRFARHKLDAVLSLSVF